MSSSSPPPPFKRRRPRRSKVFSVIWCQISNIERITDTKLINWKIYRVCIIIDLGKHFVRTSTTRLQLRLPQLREPILAKMYPDHFTRLEQHLSLRFLFILAALLLPFFSINSLVFT